MPEKPKAFSNPITLSSEQEQLRQKIVSWLEANTIEREGVRELTLPVADLQAIDSTPQDTARAQIKQIRRFQALVGSTLDKSHPLKRQIDEELKNTDDQIIVRLPELLRHANQLAHNAYKIFSNQVLIGGSADEIFKKTPQKPNQLPDNNTMPNERVLVGGSASNIEAVAVEIESERLGENVTTTTESSQTVSKELNSDEVKLNNFANAPTLEYSKLETMRSYITELFQIANGFLRKEGELYEGEVAPHKLTPSEKQAWNLYTGLNGYYYQLEERIHQLGEAAMSAQIDAFNARLDKLSDLLEAARQERRDVHLKQNDTTVIPPVTVSPSVEYGTIAAALEKSRTKNGSIDSVDGTNIIGDTTGYNAENAADAIVSAAQASHETTPAPVDTTIGETGGLQFFDLRKKLEQSARPAELANVPNAETIGDPNAVIKDATSEESISVRPFVIGTTETQSAAVNIPESRIENELPLNSLNTPENIQPTVDTVTISENEKSDSVQLPVVFKELNTLPIPVPEKVNLRAAPELGPQYETAITERLKSWLARHEVARRRIRNGFSQAIYAAMFGGALYAAYDEVQKNKDMSSPSVATAEGPQPITSSWTTATPESPVPENEIITPVTPNTAPVFVADALPEINTSIPLKPVVEYIPVAATTEVLPATSVNNSEVIPYTTVTPGMMSPVSLEQLPTIQGTEIHDPKSPEYAASLMPALETSTPLQFTVSAGDTVAKFWDTVRADIDRGDIPSYEYNQAVASVWKEIDTSSNRDLIQAMGVSSGDSHSIFAGETIDMSPAVRLLESKLADVRARMNMPDTVVVDNNLLPLALETVGNEVAVLPPGDQSRVVLEALHDYVATPAGVAELRTNDENKVPEGAVISFSGFRNFLADRVLREFSVLPHGFRQEAAYQTAAIQETTLPPIVTETTAVAPENREGISKPRLTSVDSTPAGTSVSQGPDSERSYYQFGARPAPTESVREGRENILLNRTPTPQPEDEETLDTEKTRQFSLRTPEGQKLFSEWIATTFNESAANTNNWLGGLVEKTEFNKPLQKVLQDTTVGDIVKLTRMSPSQRREELKVLNIPEKVFVKLAQLGARARTAEIIPRDPNSTLTALELMEKIYSRTDRDTLINPFN